MIIAAMRKRGMNKRYATEINTASSSTGGSSLKVTRKPIHKSWEEMVTLRHGPKHNVEVAITKGLINEKYTDNCYSEHGLTQYWHFYKRDSPADKTLYYDRSQFHSFKPYTSYSQAHLDALEKDIVSILTEVKKGL